MKLETKVELADERAAGPGGVAAIRSPWFAPGVLLGAFIFVSLTVLWLIQTNLRATRQQQLAGNTEATAASIRLRLSGNQAYLVMLAAERAEGVINAQIFQARAARYVADHPELINITWVDADFVIHDVAPLAGNQQILGLRLDLPEPKRVSHLAREQRKPVYSQPFEAIQGKPSFEVWVPVYREDNFLGLFAGVYSCEKVLQTLIPAAQRENYQVSLTDAGGKALGSLPAARTTDEKRTGRAALTGPGNGVFLQFNEYGPGVLERSLWLLEFLCAAFALGTGYAMWRLKSEMAAGKQAAAALYDAQQVFRTLVENSPDIIARYDQDCRRTYVNPTYLQVAQIPQPELLATAPLQRSPLPGASAAVLQNLLRRVLASGVAEAADLFWPKAGHNDSWFNTYAFPEFDRAGRVVSVMAVSRDITARQRAEEALVVRERHSRSLLHLSRKLESAQTYAEALNAGRAEVAAVTGYQNLWAYLLTEDKKQFKAFVAGGALEGTVMSEEGTATLTIEGDRMLEEIAAAKEIVVVEDARTDERTNKEIVARLGLRTIVNVPIILFDRHLGIIGTGTAGEEGVRPPTASEREYLMALASQMAVTFDRIHSSSKRQQAEAQREQYHKFFMLSNDPMCIADPVGCFKQVNAAFVKLTGFNEAELIAQPFIEFVVPEDRQRTVEEMEQQVKVRPTLSFENHYRRKDRPPVLLSWTAFFDRHEGVTYATARDITERKLAEEELIKARTHYQSLLETASDGIHVLNLKGELVVASDSFYRMLGYSPQDRPPLHVSDWDAQWSAEELRVVVARLLDHPQVFETRHRCRSGQVIEVEINARGVYVDGQQYLYASSRDITGRKLAEAEIHQLNAELEQRVQDRTEQLVAANQELESFSYSVSHDLRAPLRRIDGFSRILFEDYGDKLDAEGKDNVQRVRAASQRMDRLIDDLLKLARISRGELRRVAVDLTALAQSIAGELQAAGPGRGVELVIAEGLIANGDPNLLRVALENLLGNAWKFTEKKGQAKIEFGQTTGAGGSAFFVRDNGAGFDMKYVAKLFGAFQRLHDTDEFAGTGIGLATVRRIVHRHGGRVWAEGAVGRGAAFYFTLPVNSEMGTEHHER